MAPSAGYAAHLSVSTDGSSWHEAGGFDSATAKFMADQLDTTNFKSSAGNKNEIPGLHSIEFGTLSGYYDAGDTNGQIVIRTAWANRSDLYVKILWDGTNGFSVMTQVESYEIGAKVNERTTFAFSPKSNSAPTFIP